VNDFARGFLAGLILAIVMLTPAEKRLLAQPWVLQWERENRASYAMTRFVDRMHPKQQAFALDRGPAVAISGRRGGKSLGILGRFARVGAQYPHGLSAYTAVTMGRAREILEPAVLIAQDAGLPLRWERRDGLLYLRWPNGHRTWIHGCPNRLNIRVIRGSPLVAWCGDEAMALVDYLEELVVEGVQPALMDFDGEMALASSPGAVMSGYLYGVSTGDGQKKWHTHHWDARDNPFLRTPADQYFRKVLDDNGWTWETPQFQREYLGLWCDDPTALCYHYDVWRNALWGKLDRDMGTWKCLISADPGVVAQFAMVLERWQEGLPEIYVDDEFARAGLGPEAAAAHLLGWNSRYRPVLITADSGGLGKAFVKHWSDEHGLCVEPANKLNTEGQIRWVDGLLTSGRLKVSTERCQETIGQLRTVTWNDKRTNHDDRYRHDLLDAMRYGAVAAPNRYVPRRDEPQPGTAEYAARLEQREHEQHLRQLAAQRRSSHAH